MNFNSMILNRLLDKYEKRTAGSNRRVRIVCNNTDLKIPDVESDEYQDFRDAMLYLKSKKFIELDWVRKDFIINSIWLNLDNVEAVYIYLGRENITSKINSVLNLIDNALTQIEAGWIHKHLKSVRDNIAGFNKLTGIWCKEHAVLNDFLAALINIDKLSGRTVSMRAFSVKTYGDSKKFEREIKQLIIPVIKNNEPDLLDAEEISDREALAQVGIIMMSEVFEFCGNVRVYFTDGIVDFSPVSKGACLSSECVADILQIEIFETDKIIFIENKTNYTEYCLNNKRSGELVVYHGGFYSPQRGQFFRKLCSETDIPVYFWGDIDYGGFKMFVRLKNNIINTLQPLNMDIHSYNRYKDNGLKKSDEYISKLKSLTDSPDYNLFSDVITAIEEERITVEQESFLGHE